MHSNPPPSTQIVFDNSYAQLPGQFHARQNPTAVSSPALIKVNERLAHDLNLDVNYLTSPTGVQMLAGNHVPQGSDPIAMAYAGHQFGNWVPQLGDGRAILLGEVLDRDGARFGLQLKGAGRTPYSRNGDGRAWLGPVLREYVVSEAMAALNIPTTRALACVTTGEHVLREEAFPGAVLTRVAQGHIRVGTFEYFAARGDTPSLRILADYAIDRFYPDARDAPAPHLSLLKSVLARQAELIAKWMGVGFIHGVMNTDNMSVVGETIDYGPCAFIDAYHPQTVFSYIDQMGRYAYANQPDMGKWNLTRFASTLLPLVHPDEDAAVDMAQDALDTFRDVFADAWTAIFRAKLGLSMQEDEDPALIQGLLDLMAENQADFTQTFRGLSGLLGSEAIPENNPVRGLFNDPSAFDGWVNMWRVRLARETRSEPDMRSEMRAVNPAYIPRNHRVEKMITAAVDGDFSFFDRLLDVLSRPFDDQPQFASYQTPPKPSEVVQQTFCGT